MDLDISIVSGSELEISGTHLNTTKATSCRDRLHGGSRRRSRQRRELSEDAACDLAGRKLFRRLDWQGIGRIEESQVQPLWPELSRHMERNVAAGVAASLQRNSAPIGREEWNSLMVAIRSIVGPRLFRSSIKAALQHLEHQPRSPSPHAKSPARRRMLPQADQAPIIDIEEPLGDQDTEDIVDQQVVDYVDDIVAGTTVDIGMIDRNAPRDDSSDDGPDKVLGYYAGRLVEKSANDTSESRTAEAAARAEKWRAQVTSQDLGEAGVIRICLPGHSENIDRPETLRARLRRVLTDGISDGRLEESLERVMKGMSVAEGAEPLKPAALERHVEDEVDFEELPGKSKPPQSQDDVELNVLLDEPKALERNEELKAPSEESRREEKEDNEVLKAMPEESKPKLEADNEDLKAAAAEKAAADKAAAEKAAAEAKAAEEKAAAEKAAKEAEDRAAA
jgi:hypothetical protein